MHDVLAGFRLRTRVRTLARRSGPDATGSLGDMRVSKKPKSDSNDWTGRITFDDRGSASWELRTETGTYDSCLDGGVGDIHFLPPIAERKPIERACGSVLLPDRGRAGAGCSGILRQIDSGWRRFFQ